MSPVSIQTSILAVEYRSTTVPPAASSWATFSRPYGRHDNEGTGQKSDPDRRGVDICDWYRRYGCGCIARERHRQRNLRQGGCVDVEDPFSIANDSGDPTTDVVIATRQGSDTVYWVDFNARTNATTATVIMTKLTGNFLVQVQRLTGVVGGGFYILPFAVGTAGSPAGKYLVKVKFDHGPPKTCGFTAQT
jgi:hypothetical protein